VGQISGNERFIRGARQGQFVGGDSGDTAFVGAQSGAANGANRGLSQMGGLGGASQYGRGGTGGLGGMFGSQMGRNQFGMNNLNQMGQNGKRKQLRVPVRLGFEMPVTTASQNQVTTQFAARLPKFPGIQLTGPVDVSMEGKTVVLKGSVASERDRDLAERLALLEPGIASVRNELQVNPSAPPELELLPTPAAVVTPPVDD
jgi:osmotically-inducible protein OsmY